MTLPSAPGPIGIFDSGYGGLTILHGIRQLLPQYDYLYLGDNARAPYGPRTSGLGPAIPDDEKEDLPASVATAIAGCPKV